VTWAGAALLLAALATGAAGAEEPAPAPGPVPPESDVAPAAQSEAAGPGAGDGDRPLSLWGSLRGTTAAAHNYDAPALFGPGNRADGYEDLDLRLGAQGRLSPRFAYELQGVQRLVLSTFPPAASGGVTAGGLLGAVPVWVPYRAVPASWTWVNQADVTATLFLDRANVKLSRGRFDLTVGRQAVSFGKTYFWNPLDVFLPFGPTEFDRDYKAGVDAVRLDAALGNFSGLTLIGVLGRPDPSLPGTGRWFQSAALARAFATFGAFDIALQAGKIRGGAHAGAGVSGEIGPLALRGEIAGFLASTGSPLGTSVAAVGGVGHHFENSFDLEAEYFYNGGAPADRLEGQTLLLGGWLLQTSRQVAGLVASYDPHPLVHASLGLLGASSALSGAIQPGLVYSVSDDADIVAGALFPLGRHPTVDAAGTVMLDDEFGVYPQIFYVQMKAYF
jgi:hypothetical protein